MSSLEESGTGKSFVAHGSAVVLPRLAVAVKPQRVEVTIGRARYGKTMLFVLAAARRLS